MVSWFSKQSHVLFFTISNRFKCAFPPQCPDIIREIVVTTFLSTFQSVNHGLKVTDDQVSKTTSILQFPLSLPVLNHNSFRIWKKIACNLWSFIYQITRNGPSCLQISHSIVKLRPYFYQAPRFSVCIRDSMPELSSNYRIIGSHILQIIQKKCG
jgi:hypothetical protein